MCSFYYTQDGPHQFWSGYFTSRPALKRYIRTSSSLMNAVRQAQALAGVRDYASVNATDSLNFFEEGLGVAQHHDAASGTAKQHVRYIS